MQIAVLNRTARILAGHLWVFSNELATSPKRFLPGSIVEIHDKKDTFLGIGYANPNSLITIRILTKEREEINEAFFRKRITAALDYRKRFTKDKNAFRAVYSESDLLPGLVIDKYDDCISIQFLTFGMEALSETIIKVADEIFNPRVIVLKNDSSIRTLEGLPLEKKIVKGSLEEKLPVIRDGSTVMEVDPMGGQKTGFFLDQADNRDAFANLAGEGKGLDLFCYSGPWSLKLAQKGVSVLGVDSSEQALQKAERNAELSGVKEKCAFLKADVFDFIKKELPKGKVYDYIVLDPPAFVKSKAKIKEGLRGYRELNTAVMKLLKPHGLLATSSCSYHVDRALFLDMLTAAAKDAGRHVRIVEMRAQSKDHPIALMVPETEYLKCAILEVS